ncbi:MAG: succinate dehydrogenase assembly factor 2 [Proteobacteria bacterium ST_bin11]|nr:MAG: succinate dehydrogenase assembly factor 2 [Proteobacteria bacterium ST_bin11]
MNENINKLRWRCRRGTLELDLILLRYLESRYPKADISEQQTFLLLLGLEDTELMRYLMGEQLPQDELLTNLILIIRALPV